MSDYFGGETFNSFGSPSDWEHQAFDESVLSDTFNGIVSEMPEGPERERAVEILKARAFMDGLDPARVQEIYEEALLQAEREMAGGDLSGEALHELSVTNKRFVRVEQEQVTPQGEIESEGE